MPNRFSRRQILKTSAYAVAVLYGQSLAGEPCDVTAKRGAGPFYPVDPIPHMVDLTAKNGGKARGRLLALRGCVYDANCQPVPQVKVEIWQADPDGLYNHPGHKREEPLDPHFAYFGFATTDKNGIYQFKTLVPGPYRVGSLTRAPHIHFSLKHPRHQTHVTELYFSGDKAFHENDPVFQGIQKQKRPTLVMDLEDTPGLKNWSKVGFDIHLSDLGS